MPPDDLINNNIPTIPPNTTTYCPCTRTLFSPCGYQALPCALELQKNSCMGCCQQQEPCAKHSCPPYPPFSHPGLTSVPPLPLHVLVPTLDSVACMPASRILLVDSLSPLPGSVNRRIDHSVSGQTLKARTTPWTMLYDKTFPGESQHTHLLTLGKEPMTDRSTDIKF